MPMDNKNRLERTYWEFLRRHLANVWAFCFENVAKGGKIRPRGLNSCVALTSMR